MMFFKAVFALYFAAIALAAPKSGLVRVGDVCKLRVNPCPLMLCTSLSNVDVDDNDIIKGIANDADVI
jgi:hypothetical protein